MKCKFVLVVVFKYYFIRCKFGTVDNDWRGNSGIIVQNPTPFSYIIIPNSRLAQGVIVEKKRAVFDIKSSKDELSKTERGENGFGKSGLM